VQKQPELRKELKDRPDELKRRYDYNNVRPHFSLGNQTPAEAREQLSNLRVPRTTPLPKLVMKNIKFKSVILVMNDKALGTDHGQHY
jgi:hypothetical protein